MRAINVSLASVLALMGCCCPLWSSKADKPAEKTDATGAVVKQDQSPVPKTDKDTGRKAPPGSDVLFTSIANTLRDGKHKDVGDMGQFDKTIRDAATEGGVLIGLQVGTERFGASVKVKSIRPIYLTKNGEKLGAWMGKDQPANPIVTKAKEGYVVGGLDIKSGAGFEAFSLRFVKLDNNQLKVDDNYASPWIGHQASGVPARRIGGKGVLAVGVITVLWFDTPEPTRLDLITVP